MMRYLPQPRRRGTPPSGPVWPGRGRPLLALRAWGLCAIAASSSCAIAEPDALELVPTEVHLAPGEHVQVRAIGHYGEGEADLSTQVQWCNLDEKVVAVSPSGRVSARGGGLSLIHAQLGAVRSAPVPIRVSDEVPKALVVRPQRVTLAVGEERQLEALALFVGSEREQVTASAVWIPDDASVVEVGEGGRLLGRRPGTVQVWASWGGVSAAAATVAVEAAPEVVALEVDPPWLLLRRPREGAQLTAYAWYADGSSEDVTATALWTSSDRAVAEVRAGWVTAGEEPGVALVTASEGGVASTPVLVQVWPLSPGHTSPSAVLDARQARAASRPSTAPRRPTP